MEMREVWLQMEWQAMTPRAAHRFLSAATALIAAALPSAAVAQGEPHRLSLGLPWELIAGLLILACIVTSMVFSVLGYMEARSLGRRISKLEDCISRISRPK